MRRRELLQLCGLAAGSYALGGARASTPPSRPPRRLICVFVTGGWDTTYAIDPKDPAYADIPAGAVRTFDGLDIFCDESRPNVTAFFERYGGATAVVRGISTDAINHNECQRRIATGTREETRPDVAAIVAHDLGNDLPLPYLVLGDTAWTGAYAASAGRIGDSNQIVGLLDPGATSRGVTFDRGPSDAEQAVLRAYAEASTARMRAVRGATGYNKRRLDDFVTALRRSDQLRALRDRFGAPGNALPYAAQIQLAVDALDRDLSHATTISTRLGWDTHGDNYLQGEFHDATFAGLVTLADALAARPGRTAGATLFDETTIAVFSEMARTPRLRDAADPHAGKEHWPVTSALVIGGGVRGGRSYGGTDAYSGALACDLATGAIDPLGTRILYSHFVAGLLAQCGVDPTLHLETPALHAFVG